MDKRIDSDEVLYEVSEHIATITLNAPDRMNTISGPMLRTLSDYLLEADRDPEVRCIILTGKGRAFCAGLDLRPQSGGVGGLAGSGATTSTTLDLRNTPPTVLFEMEKPTICALNGGAAGYGMDTALGCDIRHADEIVYARGLDTHDPAFATPIGIGCKVCERTNCPQRAFPPAGRPLAVDENRSPVAPYATIS